MLRVVLRNEVYPNNVTRYNVTHRRNVT